MWCRYEFFLVYPNSYDDYKDDWDEDYIGVDFGKKDDKLCIIFSQKSKVTGKIKMVNGSEIYCNINDINSFKGIDVGLHLNSVYDLPSIPNKSLSVLNVMEKVYGFKPKDNSS